MKPVCSGSVFKAAAAVHWTERITWHNSTIFLWCDFWATLKTRLTEIKIKLKQTTSVPCLFCINSQELTPRSTAPGWVAHYSVRSLTSSGTILKFVLEFDKNKTFPLHWKLFAGFYRCCLKLTLISLYTTINVQCVITCFGSQCFLWSAKHHQHLTDHTVGMLQNKCNGLSVNVLNCKDTKL